MNGLEEEAAASLIGGEPLDDKGLENVANRGIALNGKVGVKAAHVGRCPRGGELEVLHKEVGLGHGLVKAFFRHVEDEFHLYVRVEVVEILEAVIVFLAQELVEKDLVHLCPSPHREFVNGNGLLVFVERIGALGAPGRGVDALLDTLEAKPPGVEVPVGERRQLSREATAHQGHNVGRIVGRNVRGKARADADTAVEGNQRHDGQIILGLYEVPVIVDGLEENLVLLAKENVHQGVQLRVNIPRARRILAAQESAAELSNGLEEADIVGADKGLGHADNSRIERGLAVVVGGVLRDIAC